MTVAYCENVWMSLWYDQTQMMNWGWKASVKDYWTLASYYPASMIQREVRICNVVVYIWYDDILTVCMLWPPGEGLEKDVLNISHQKILFFLALKQLGDV